MKRFLGLLVTLLTLPLNAATPLKVGIPVDVVILGQSERQSLLMLYRNAASEGNKPLNRFWNTWNEAAFARAARSLTAVQKISWEHVVPSTPAVFEAVSDSASAIESVASGKLPLAWVRGDILQDKPAAVVKVVEGRAYFDRADQEEFVLVARKEQKFPQLGLLDAQGMERASRLIKRNGLKFGYGGLPEEARRPFREAGIDPFASDGSLSPALYVRQYQSETDGIDLLIAGANGNPGVDLAVIDPPTWRYYQMMYPGRSKAVVPVLTTDQYLVLSRPNQLPENRFALSEPATQQFLKRARLGIYGRKAREPFRTLLTGDAIGRRALEHEVLAPAEQKLDDSESAIDAVATPGDLDVIVVRKNSFEAYGLNKPGVYRALEILGTLPRIANPVLIANPTLVDAAVLANLRRDLLAYHWRTAKTFAGGFILLRNFTHYSLPEGETR